MIDERALNRQIAELLGYTCQPDKQNSRGVLIFNPDGAGVDGTFTIRADKSEAVERAWSRLLDPGQRYVNDSELPPLWSSDTNAALSLLNTLPPELRVEIHRGELGFGGDAIWRCEITSRTDGRLAWSVGRCDTPAEAICSAFIEYKKYKQKAGRQL